MVDKTKQYEREGNHIQMEIKTQIANAQLEARAKSKDKYQQLVDDAKAADDAMDSLNTKIDQWNANIGGAVVDDQACADAEAKVKVWVGNLDRLKGIAASSSRVMHPVDDEAEAKAQADAQAKAQADAQAEAQAKRLTDSLGEYCEGLAAKVNGMNDAFRKIAAFAVTQEAVKGGGSIDWKRLSDEQAEMLFDYMTACKTKKEIEDYKIKDRIGELRAKRKYMAEQKQKIMDDHVRDEDGEVSGEVAKKKDALYGDWSNKPLVLAKLRGNIPDPDAPTGGTPAPAKVVAGDGQRQERSTSTP